MWFWISLFLFVFFIRACYLIGVYKKENEKLEANNKDIREKNKKLIVLKNTKQWK